MKHFRHKKLLIILAILILAFLIFLVYMAVHEQRRHDQLSNSIDALQVSLKQHGIKAEKSMGCGRPYAEVGRGYKSCAMGLNYKLQVESSNQADVVMGNYSAALAQTPGFAASRPLPTRLSEVNGIDFGQAYYSAENAKRYCSAHYHYDEDDENKGLQIQFSCDDTSWFVRTFENIL